MTSIQQHYIWRERQSNGHHFGTLSRFANHGHGAGISLGSAQHSPGPGIAHGLAWSKRSRRSDSISTSCASFHQKLRVSTAYKAYIRITMYTLFLSMLWIIKVAEKFYPAAVTFHWIISFTWPQLQLTRQWPMCFDYNKHHCPKHIEMPWYLQPKPWKKLWKLRKQLVILSLAKKQKRISVTWQESPGVLEYLKGWGSGSRINCFFCGYQCSQECR